MDIYSASIDSAELYRSKYLEKVIMDDIADKIYSLSKSQSVNSIISILSALMLDVKLELIKRPKPGFSGGFPITLDTNLGKEYLLKEAAKRLSKVYPSVNGLLLLEAMDIIRDTK